MAVHGVGVGDWAFPPLFDLATKITPRRSNIWCATQIFFPNSRARAADYVDGFGLTEHEFELVRSLPDTSRCFLIKRGDHSVVARLDLSGLSGELAVLAGTERAVRRLEALRGELGDAPADWLGPFMEGRSAA